MTIVPISSAGVTSKAMFAGREALRPEPGEVRIGLDALARELVGAARQRGCRILAAGLGARERIESALQRPGEVDGRRPRRSEQVRGGFDADADLARAALPAVYGEREAIGGGEPDRGRSAHGQRADRVRHLLGVLAAQPPLLVGQCALVEDQQRAVDESQRTRLNRRRGHEWSVHYQPEEPGPPLNGPVMSLVTQPP